jgi:shikimate dehydrogenase
MPPGRPPMSTTTRLYGIFADSAGQRPMTAPALFNALFDRHGIDAIFVPFQVTPAHVAAAIAGMRHLRNFAGFAVTMPHKAAVAQLCDTLLPNAQACGVVNTVRIDPDGRLIGETFDGVGMVQALTAHRALDARTRVLLVGAGGVGQAIAVALALAGVGSLTITNRTQAKADALAHMVRRAAPTCTVEARAAVDPAGFDIVINERGTLLRSAPALVVHAHGRDIRTPEPLPDLGNIGAVCEHVRRRGCAQPVHAEAVHIESNADCFVVPQDAGVRVASQL